MIIHNVYRKAGETMKKQFVTFQVEQELVKDFDKSLKYKTRSQALRDFMINSVEKSKKTKV